MRGRERERERERERGREGERERERQQTDRSTIALREDVGKSVRERRKGILFGCLTLSFPARERESVSESTQNDSFN